MDVGAMVLLAAIAVATLLTALMRFIGWRTIIRYHAFVDVAFTLMLIWMFAGTVSGMIIGIIGGLIMTIVLSIGKRFTRLEPRQKLR